ncbi:MAG: YbgC/FadM family acyl-CoA thioesterase [Myxococcales bacterium]|nr:YbgC/FadM family acyl-CoA thioesterase [Myxococcales bacterium]MCB9662912.1 YbgC/FadM family acyl-CoA thioesterase [Alphaproteobacteria bacterium]
MSRYPAVHEVRVYYEDTDFSGAVYHAGYLRFMERAREHLLGPDALVQLWQEHRTGFVVYKVELTYREPARFGDVLEVRTTPTLASEWRIRFQQDVWRQGGASPLVEGWVELVCVDGANKLTKLPEDIRRALAP